MALFTEAESARIAATVAAVEEKTAGEIVVATVPRSDAHTKPRFVGALGLGVTATIVAGGIFPKLPVEGVLLVELVAGVVGYLLAGVPPILRFLAGKRALEAAAQERALRAFAEYGVFDTRDRTGVLIFLSALERRAVVLGDRGIHARVGAAGFEKLVGELTAALHENHGVDGVCRVVEEIGEVLARDVPRRHDDANELPNVPIEAPEDRR